MAIGKDARGVSPGIVYGGWRPVATYFGVKAQRSAPARRPIPDDSFARVEGMELPMVPLSFLRWIRPWFCEVY